MDLRKYITNVSALQFFQVFRFGVLILIQIFFAKSSFSQSTIGDFEFFLFLAGALSFFWLSGTIESLLPLYKNNTSLKNNDSDNSPEFFNAFAVLSILSVIVAFAVFFLEKSLVSFSDRHESIPFFYYFILYVLLSSPANLVEYIYLLKKQPEKIIIYGAITFSLQLIVVGVPALLGLDVTYSVAGLVLISALRYIWLIIILIKDSSFRISISFIKEHMQLAYPLMLAALLSGSAQYIDGFLVSMKFDEATFAVFRFGAKEFPLVLLLSVAFSNSMIPEFANKGNLANAISTIRVKSTRLMHILFPASILLLLLSNFLFPVVFRPEFAESAKVFNVYLLVITCRLIFPQTILKGLKKTRIIMFAAFVEIIINVGLSIIFINIWGIVGVAYATLISFVFERIIMIIYNKKKLGIASKEYINLKLLFLYSAVLILVYILIDGFLY